uniref:GrpE protein homolog n=1 Tax=Blastobotrys adeninivorans TaxID=409370 RepID=A0A060T7V7_BLAAD
MFRGALRAGVVRPRMIRVAPVPVARTVVRPAAAPSLRGVRFYSEAKEEPKEEATKEEPKEEAAAEAEGAEPESEAAKWKAKWEAKDKECAMYKDKFARSVADFRNLQESTKREIQKAKDFALQKFARDLLESLDNFDRALSAVPEEKRADNDNHKELADLYTGIKMTQDVFEKTLARHGVTKINPVGEKFDPNQHEATFEVPQPDKEPGTVFHVQQNGYALNNRVLRAAKVGVVKGTD